MIGNFLSVIDFDDHDDIERDDIEPCGNCDGMGMRAHCTEFCSFGWERCQVCGGEGWVPVNALGYEECE